jgi:hypothetical protein
LGADEAVGLRLLERAVFMVTTPPTSPTTKKAKAMRPRVLPAAKRTRAVRTSPLRATLICRYSGTRRMAKAANMARMWTSF